MAAFVGKIPTSGGPLKHFQGVQGAFKHFGGVKSALKPLWHLKRAFFDRKCLKALLELFEAGAKVLFLVQSAFLHFRTTCGARVHANGQSKVLFRPPAVVPSARQKHKVLFSQQRGFFSHPKVQKSTLGCDFGSRRGLGFFRLKVLLSTLSPFSAKKGVK